MSRYRDTVALVTGAASGIGRALCLELGRRGAVVVATDSNERGAGEVAETIRAAGGRAVPAKLDVTAQDEVERVIAQTIDDYGRIDFVFNNAGICINGEVRDLAIEHWRRVFDVNLMGVLNGTLIAYRAMLRQGFGHIVNTSSLGGILPMPMNAPYSASKYAVVGMTGSIYAEAKELGINVSVVCPGLVRTNIFEDSPSVGLDRAKFAELIPKKMTEPSDAARIILRGVARRKPVIVFPFRARMLWRFSRYFPGLLILMGPILARSYRRFRTAG